MLSICVMLAPPCFSGPFSFSVCAFRNFLFVFGLYISPRPKHSWWVIWPLPQQLISNCFLSFGLKTTTSVRPFWSPTSSCELVVLSASSQLLPLIQYLLCSFQSAFFLIWTLLLSAVAYLTVLCQEMCSALWCENLDKLQNSIFSMSSYRGLWETST